MWPNMCWWDWAWQLTPPQGLCNFHKTWWGHSWLNPWGLWIMVTLHIATLLTGVLTWGQTRITLVTPHLSFFNPAASPFPAAGAATVVPLPWVIQGWGNVPYRGSWVRWVDLSAVGMHKVCSSLCFLGSCWLSNWWGTGSCEQHSELCCWGSARSCSPLNLHCRCFLTSNFLSRDLMIMKGDTKQTSEDSEYVCTTSPKKI